MRFYLVDKNWVDFDDLSEPFGIIVPDSKDTILGSIALHLLKSYPNKICIVMHPNRGLTRMLDFNTEFGREILSYVIKLWKKYTRECVE
jgi:hypothetical protein